MAALPAYKVNPDQILVVDDELDIRRSLDSVLRDEGFVTILAEDGEQALEILKETKPSLVILDIWMPGSDGIETLSKIKELYPEIPVIMVSGHTTIATAMKATRMGAEDFIEKPLDLNAILQSVRRAIGGAPADDSLYRDSVVSDNSPSGLLESIQIGRSNLNRIVFQNQTAPGARVQQKTIARSAVLYGQGLHTGKKSGLALEPLPPDSGIHFVGVSGNDIVPGHVDFVESTGFATTVKFRSTQVSTIEHLMSALHAYRISNLLIKCQGEVPVMDGSALEFCSLFEDIGIEEQDGYWSEVAIDKVVTLKKGSEFIQIEPAESLIIDYTLDYPSPVGKQRYVFNLSDVNTYKKEIAPARTFGFVKDIGALQKAGLALGGRLDNVILIGADGVINGELRFPNELVRHKILDLIGDIYLLGRPIRGKITACMTGHSDNIGLLKRISVEILGR